MSKRKLIALDLAKSVIQVAVEDLNRRKIVSNRPMSPKRLKQFLANQPPCTIAMEACGSAHHWCWFAEAQGHQVILLAAPRCDPLSSGPQNRSHGCPLAILEAAKRPDCKEAVKKTPELLALQMFHQVRQQHVDHKRKLSNQIRGHLVGVWGTDFRKAMPPSNGQSFPLLEDADNGLPDLTRSLTFRLYPFLDTEQQSGADE